MSNGSVISARNTATDLVNFRILLKGNIINQEYRIISLDTAKSFNKVSFAKIVIQDGDPSQQDFAISSHEENLKPGTEIEIAMGYHDESETIFKGIIIKHAIRSGKNKASSLIIEAKDKAISLTIGRKSHCFTDKTDKDIIESIISQSGYGGSVEFHTAGTPFKHTQMVQFNAIDWDFIVSRAEMNGMLVLTDDNKLLVAEPDTSQSPAKEIVFGMDVLEFESELDAGSQLKQITSHAWNYKDQKVDDSPEASVHFTETGNVNGESLAQALGIHEYHLSHSGSLSKDELKSWSNAQLLKSRIAKASGRIKIRGTTEIKTGQVIKMSGFSERFNGNVFVTGIRHSYSEAAWETDIQFGLPEQWFYQREDIIEKPASGLLPAINGLQIGIVMQLESDPDGQHRVKVKLPLVDMQTGIWARVASLDAGKDRGSFFRPEINDEVVVGFFNDDPRYPVILGMLNSSDKPAPIEAKDTNHEKGFTTRSKMKLTFNDEKKIITIETPKGKKIEINEDSNAIILSDENRNKVSLTSDGITLESGKDISLKAATGDIKLEALNIENKANVKFSAQANAQAELQASGIMVIKGAMVNIN